MHVVRMCVSASVHPIVVVSWPCGCVRVIATAARTARTDERERERSHDRLGSRCVSACVACVWRSMREPMGEEDVTEWMDGLWGGGGGHLDQ